MLLRRRSGALALLLAASAGVAVLVVEAFAPASLKCAWDDGRTCLGYH